MNIPLFKVFIPPRIIDALQETLNSGYIAGGKKAEEFTEKIGEFIENPAVTTTNSCTMALTIAYRLAGVGRGDEVITTPLTSIATNVPILSLGAKPIWADVEKDTGMTDPKSIEPLINKKTKAIVVLNKDGDLAKLNEINEIAKKYNISVIEDAAHSFGAIYKGKKIGSVSDFTCFSFQAIKHITCGDGGALVCKKGDDYFRARKLKWFGVDKAMGYSWKDDVTEWGYKGELNDLAATIGLEQMEYVERIVATFHRNGIIYQELLKNIPGIKNIKREEGCFPVFWVYTFLTKNRDRLIKNLKEEGIEAMQVHPRNDVWSIFKDSRRKLPGVDYFDKKEISIPCGWWVTLEDAHRIASVIKKNS